MSTLRVLAFAGARDVLGASEISFPVATPITARALLDALCVAYPALLPWAPALRVAVDGAYASWDETIEAGAEVAIIPPVAGGA